MKRIYLFGRIVRLSFLISSIFVIYAFVDNLLSEFSFKNLFLLFLAITLVISTLIWIYSKGFFIDRKNNKLKIILGYLKNERKEIYLSDIDSIDVELTVYVGMVFTINYNNNSSEKMQYTFYRVPFFQKLQYKRIKKQLSKIKY